MCGSRITAASSPPYDAATADALDQYLLGEPFALFVSSAHPPNAFGLIETAEATDLCLKGGSLLVAGEVSNLLFETPAFWRNQHIFARTRLRHVSQPMLGALYAAANVVILPKTRGGGSNLKTAEALLSGRPTVATPKAFPGVRELPRAPRHLRRRIAGGVGRAWIRCCAIRRNRAGTGGNVRSRTCPGRPAFVALSAGPRHSCVGDGWVWQNRIMFAPTVFSERFPLPPAHPGDGGDPDDTGRGNDRKRREMTKPAK